MWSTGHGNSALPHFMAARAAAANVPHPGECGYAVGLYIAHFASLYLKTYSLGSDSVAQAAGRADQVGAVKSAAMGDTSISYDNSAVAAGTEKWGAWNATQYGSQLVTMARMVGMGGMFVI